MSWRFNAAIFGRFGRGQPCKPGETAEKSGCIPAKKEQPGAPAPTSAPVKEPDSGQRPPADSFVSRLKSGKITPEEAVKAINAAKGEERQKLIEEYKKEGGKVRYASRSEKVGGGAPGESQGSAEAGHPGVPTVRLWRATSGKDAYFGEGTWWAETEEDGRAYTDNPGFGGPDLFHGEMVDDPKRILDLTDDPGPNLLRSLNKDTRDGILRGIYDSLSSEGYEDDEIEELGLDQLAEKWWDYQLERGLYSHDIVDENIKNIESPEKYDWVRIHDSFPVDAITRRRMSDLSEEEGASITLKSRRRQRPSGGGRGGGR